MLKNRILTIFIALMLVSPVFAETPATAGEGLTPIVENTLPENVVATTQEELPSVDLIPHKQPVSKKKIAKKFLMAMGGVALSSILLFLILTLYNKIRAGFLAPKAEQTNGETSLVTPENLTDAVRTFLDKTKY